MSSRLRSLYSFYKANSSEDIDLLSSPADPTCIWTYDDYHNGDTAALHISETWERDANGMFFVSLQAPMLCSEM